MNLRELFVIGSSPRIESIRKAGKVEADNRPDVAHIIFKTLSKKTCQNFNFPKMCGVSLMYFIIDILNSTLKMCWMLVY